MDNDMGPQVTTGRVLDIVLAAAADHAAALDNLARRNERGGMPDTAQSQRDEAETIRGAVRELRAE